RVGVLFGLGHGGIEAMLLVGLGLAASFVFYALFASGHLPDMGTEAREKVVEKLGALRVSDLAPAVLERVMAMTMHVAFSLVVLRAVVRRSLRWLALAVLFHFVIDFTSAVEED